MSPSAFACLLALVDEDVDARIHLLFDCLGQELARPGRVPIGVSFAGKHQGVVGEPVGELYYHVR